MKKISVLSLVFATSLLAIFIAQSGYIFNNEANSVSAVVATLEPGIIKLNDTSEANIRNYYSSVLNKNGTELLKSLKVVLKSGHTLPTFDGGDDIWQMYEITDRDWNLSPKQDAPGYDKTTNTIKIKSKNNPNGYEFGVDCAAGKQGNSNPYLQALYLNRDATNFKRAWDSHTPRSDNACIEREHIWPRSHGFSTDSGTGALADPMHLRAADGHTNNIHRNLHYGYVDKTLKGFQDLSKTTSMPYKEQIKGNYKGVSKTLYNKDNPIEKVVFEPVDSDKGDIARACFYMVARYNNLASATSGIDAEEPYLALTSNPINLAQAAGISTPTTPYYLGILDDLLEWNRKDPPDQFEIHRNNLLYENFTGNRNPFIDFPHWAELIWGNNQTGVTNPMTDSLNTITNEGGSVIPNPTPGGDTDVRVDSVTLNKSTLDMKVGDTFNLIPTISPSNATNKGVSYSSSASEIASVNTNGVVTAQKVGNAIITVTTNDGNKKATCSINITSAGGNIPAGETRTAIYTIDSRSSVTKAGEAPLDSTCSFNSTTTSGQITRIGVGNSMTFKLSGYDGFRIKSVTLDARSNASSGSGKVFYNFGNETTENIIIPDSAFNSSNWNGAWNNMTFTPIEKNTDILVPDNKTLNITIFSSANALYINKISVTYANGNDPVITPVNGVTLNASSLNLTVGDTQKLTETVSPENATNKEVVWSSNASNVASVDQIGNVTAKASGNAVITVETLDGKFKATCNISVKEKTVPVTSISVSPKNLELTVGDISQLNHTILPADATNKEVAWSSNRDDLCSVDQSGKITGLKAGQAIIEVTSSDNNGLKDSCTVTIKDKETGGGGETPPFPPTPGENFKTTREAASKPISPTNVQTGQYFIVSANITNDLVYINSNEGIDRPTQTPFTKGLDTNYFEVTKDSVTGQIQISNPEKNKYLSYVPKTSSGTDLDILSTPDATNSSWTIQTTLVKKYGVEDPNICRLQSVSTPDRSISLGKSTFGAFSNDNCDNKDYCGLYFYELAYTYDLLIEELECLTCDTMLQAPIHDNLVRLFSKLTQEELNALQNQVVNLAGGGTQNAYQLYQYALSRYSSPTNAQAQDFINQNGSSIIMSIFCFGSCIIVGAFVYKKLKHHR